MCDSFQCYGTGHLFVPVFRAKHSQICADASFGSTRHLLTCLRWTPAQRSSGSGDPGSTYTYAPTCGRGAFLQAILVDEICYGRSGPHPKLRACISKCLRPFDGMAFISERLNGVRVDLDTKIWRSLVIAQLNSSKCMSCPTVSIKHRSTSHKTCPGEAYGFYTSRERRRPLSELHPIPLPSPARAFVRHDRQARVSHRWHLPIKLPHAPWKCTRLLPFRRTIPHASTEMQMTRAWRRQYWEPRPRTRI
ncbi:hypothetical protein FA95DRAFT_530618 [Auriscalpium vulgare]|uniref:Uncharacterized protein n=1 Tax=Auriscalpium vulgare TaxID=40419 RepID=A0ACB8S315_9AGAM|nr:hypothetical protein FA95DRAFT_530618 [Auriscalpium vulgare]